jgi:hypothetical protein
VVLPLVLAAATCGAPLDLPPPPPQRPTYALTATIGARTVQGTSRITFALERATDRIVFRLWPNMPVQSALGSRLTVRNVRVNGTAVDTTEPDPTTLVLERPLGGAERVAVSMRWTLQLPRRPTDRLAATSSGVRLSSFFPLLAWSGSDWALDPPARQMETWTSPTADFDVRIKTAKGMRVFATGATVGKEHWRATAVRDFVVDASRHFKVARRVVHAPAPVIVTVAAESDLVFLGTYLETASKALVAYSKRYAPYPWRTFTVVITADSLSLGFEYPTLVFLSSDLPGFVAAHETAHQWFYSLVGNDQARDPWLDEALAEWATARFGDSVAAEAATPIPAEVVDRLGESMSFWGPLPFRPFVWDGIYMQGVKALASFGDDERVDCALRAYVHSNAYRVAVPRDLLDALNPFFPNAERVLTGYGVRF